MSERDRWKRLSNALAAGGVGDPYGAELARACRVLLRVDGAAISLLSGHHRSLLGVSDQTTALVEELQFTLGEGPSIEAGASDRPVRAPDLGAPSAGRRWPAFASSAVEAGVRAAFSFPLRVGAAAVGALTVYRDSPGSLASETHGEALVAASLVTQAVLAAQAGAPTSALAPDLAAAGMHLAEVHQASGMISAQLGIDIAEALLRLRSYAYAASRSVGDVAADVVARRLRLDS